ncbi:hypothetical protein BBJ28_00006528 [Nothophytophthora sp. Chile5]|nr:hypothetical protein BBJ28_00006528 [Nothophytophthora sp. Chile5]
MDVESGTQAAARLYSDKVSVGVGMWTDEEHARFLEGVKLFSNGPWKRVAAYVGTRNVRQTMTHAQKYRLKAARRVREAQRKQTAARHGISESNRSDSPVRQRSQQSPVGGGLGLGAYSKLRLPCSCPQQECPHMEDASKMYMSIADAVDILDSESSTGSPTSPSLSEEGSRENLWLSIEKLQPSVKIEAFSSDDLLPMDSSASDSDEYPTLEDCASELLDLLF